MVETMASSPSLAFHVKRREPEIVVPVKATPWELNKLSDIDDQEGMRSLFPTKQSLTLILQQQSLKEDPLAHLQHLPCLIHLEFLQVYEGESLHFKAGIEYVFGFCNFKCAGLARELVNVLRAAGQIVPDGLLKFGTHQKKLRISSKTVQEFKNKAIAKQGSSVRLLYYKLVNLHSKNQGQHFQVVQVEPGTFPIYSVGSEQRAPSSKVLQIKLEPRTVKPVLCKSLLHKPEGIPAEVEYIFCELELVKAFLRDADANEDRDQNLNVWVKQVIDVAYQFKLRFIYFHGCHRLSSSLRSSSSCFVYKRLAIDQGCVLLLEEADFSGNWRPHEASARVASENESGRQVVSVVGNGGKDFHSGKEINTLRSLHNMNNNWLRERIKDLQLQIRRGGLPPAIVAISAVLVTKAKAVIDEWAILCRTFGPEIE
ncbi:hypothetical protein FNV43_RR10382 [Rhamnella rubrinervis]|uniref:Disease resistance N-terminal domain-containing protein n=1 Tax=Rhamnella rubrinervis TaxID=2594499 RepID=A0A8K0HC44_9ROSA|nr:hypothetical protein FNV43_RR10382 [Rhamnella rubrinervis]